MNKLHIGSKKKKVLIGVAIVVGVYASYTVGWTVGRGSVAVPSSPNTPQAIQVTGAPTPAELFVDVNRERVAIGEAPLVDDPLLDLSAISKCSDMVDNNYRAHDSPQGSSWQSFFPADYQNYHIGENLSWDYASSQEAVDGWMGSPGHKSNIIDSSFTHVGYAVCGKANPDGTANNDVVQQFRGDN